MDQLDLEEDSLDGEMIAEVYRELEKEIKSQYETEGAEEIESVTEEAMAENHEEMETAGSEEHVNIEEEAMYIRDGNLLWPRVYLDLAYNLIEKIPARELPNLATLRLDANKIKKVTNLTKRYFPKLKFLSLTSNQISSLRFPWSNNLVYLYLGYNNIRSLEGLEGLYKLRVLHLRGNLIMTVNHLASDLICLQYLNLRDNKIADLRCIEYLVRFKYLTELILTGNPFTYHPVTRRSYKATVIKWLPQLLRINKQQVNEGMKAEAEHPDIFGGEEADEHLARHFSYGGEELDSDDASDVQ